MIKGKGKPCAFVESPSVKKERLLSELNSMALKAEDAYKKGDRAIKVSVEILYELLKIVRRMKRKLTETQSIERKLTYRAQAFRDATKNQGHHGPV